MSIGLPLVGGFAYANNTSPIAPELHASVAEGDVTFGIFFAEDESADWGEASGVYSHIAGSPFKGGLARGELNLAIVVGVQGSTPAAPSLAQSGGAPSICAFTVSYSGSFDADPMDMVGAFFAIDVLNDDPNNYIGPISGIGPVAPGAGVIVIGVHADSSTAHTLTTGDGLTWGELGHGSTSLGADSSLWADYAVVGSSQSIGDKTWVFSGFDGAKSGGGIIISFVEVGSGATIKTLTDQGGAVEAAVMSSHVAAFDSAAASDFESVGAGVSVSDTASAADAQPVTTVMQQIIDTALAVDGLPGVSALITISHQAAAIEYLSAAVAINVADFAIGGDLLAAIKSAIKVITDIAGGIDGFGLSVNVKAVDAALAGEALPLQVALSALDVSRAVDVIKGISDTIKLLADVGRSVDRSIVGVSAQVVDASLAIDAPALAVALSIDDIAGALESFGQFEHLLKVISETVSGIDGLSVTVSAAVSDQSFTAESSSIAAILRSLDLAGADDIAVKYVPGTRIVTRIDFTLKSRQIQSALKTRGITFTLH